MASPAWFFSTLAQATAASIGFVVAFSAALYTSRRARQRERINEFQHDIRDFVNQSEGAIDDMRDRLRALGDFEPNYDVYSIDGPPVEGSRNMREWAEDQPDSEIAYLWANLRWLTSLLHSIQRETSPEGMSNKLDALENPVLNILTSFDTIPEDHVEENPPFARLYREVTEGMNGPPAEYTEDYHIFGTLPQLNEYLSQHSHTNTTGATMIGWATAVEQIADSYYYINNLQYFNTDLFDTDVVGPVLRTCRTLFIVGVILPTLLLLTLPKSSIVLALPIFFTTSLQIVVLVLTGVYGYRLFTDLIELVGESEF